MVINADRFTALEVDLIYENSPVRGNVLAEYIVNHSTIPFSLLQDLIQLLKRALKGQDRKDTTQRKLYMLPQPEKP